MTSPQQIVAFFQNLGWPELLVIGIVALLIFGRRLPEVGRSLGRSIVEFKKGLKDTSEEIKQSLPDKSDLSASADQPGEKERQREKAGDFNSP